MGHVGSNLTMSNFLLKIPPFFNFVTMKSHIFAKVVIRNESFIQNFYGPFQHNMILIPSPSYQHPIMVVKNMVTGETHHPADCKLICLPF